MVGPVMGGGSGAETTFSARWINLSSKNVCPIALGLPEERWELVTAHAIALPGDGAVLAKATVRASVMQGLNAVMQALQLVRVYRSLDALVGADEGKRMLWMTGFNEALRGVPQQLVQRVDGLEVTLAYLDALRAPPLPPDQLQEGHADRGVALGRLG